MQLTVPSTKVLHGSIKALLRILFATTSFSHTATMSFSHSASTSFSHTATTSFSHTAPYSFVCLNLPKKIFFKISKSNVKSVSRNERRHDVINFKLSWSGYDPKIWRLKRKAFAPWGSTQRRFKNCFYKTQKKSFCRLFGLIICKRELDQLSLN